MTTTLVPPLSTSEWCRQFVERRCGSFVSAALTDDATHEHADGAAEPPVLSVAEIDLATDVQSAAQHEHVAVLALGVRDHPEGAAGRLALRFVTPSTMRSASRAHGSRWLVNEVALPTPPGLDDVSLLVYRVRRTPRLARVLEVVEKSVDVMEGAADEDGLVLGRAVLEQLEVLDDSEEAAIVLSGRQLRFTPSARPGDERYVAVVAGGPNLSRAGKLWLVGRKLHEGPDRASAARVDGRPYLLLRYGPRSTRQSVREFIDEIRRRHQPQPSEVAAREKTESFATFVDRQADERRQDVINATFGHHTMLPVVTPVALEVASNLEQTIALTDDPPSRFKQLISDMRTSVETFFGVRVPGLRARLNETDLPDGTYIIMLDEIPLASGNVDPEQLLCLATPTALASALGGDWNASSGVSEATLPDGSGRKACWIPADRGEEVASAGFTTWDAAAYITAHLRSVITRNLDMFALLDELETSFSKVEEGEPDSSTLLTLLTRLREAPGGLPRFAEIARSLLLEQLPIKPLRPLTLQYLEVADGLTLDVAEALRRVPAVSASVTSGAPEWRLFDLADEYEGTVRQGVHRKNGAAVLVLEPEVTQKLLTAVRRAVTSSLDGEQPVVVVVKDASLRPFIRSLLVLEFPRVRVVARREIEGVGGLPPAEVITV